MVLGLGALPPLLLLGPTSGRVREPVFTATANLSNETFAEG